MLSLLTVRMRRVRFAALPMQSTDGFPQTALYQLDHRRSKSVPLVEVDALCEAIGCSERPTGIAFCFAAAPPHRTICTLIVIRFDVTATGTRQLATFANTRTVAKTPLENQAAARLYQRRIRSITDCRVKSLERFFVGILILPFSDGATR